MYYFGEAPLVPAAGGQGAPFGGVPALSEFPGVEDEEPELGEVPGVPEPVVPAVLGKVPQGEPLGDVPGVLEVFGFTVDGCVLVPGVAGFVEFAPGTLEGELGVAAPVGAVPAGGVAVPAGGVAVLAGGVAE